MTLDISGGSGTEVVRGRDLSHSPILPVFSKKATWQMRGVDPVFTLFQAGVSRGAGRGPLPAIVLPGRIA